MKLHKKITIFPLILFLILGINALSQETREVDNDLTNEFIPEKGFRVGFYVGSYFANQYTASIYDGYGFDIDGNKNNWDNSLMNQKINMEYGGYGFAGQPDIIAQELNVDYHTWKFDVSDMPYNMRYTPSFSVGLNCIYSVDIKNAIILNINLSKLNIGGNFTIITPQQSNVSQMNNDHIKVFAIKGSEQRMMFQFGYQKIVGDNEKINFFVEGGLHVTVTKFDKNEILINNLRINLTSYYNTVAYSSALPVRNPIGTGLGVFGGLGANITLNPKIIIQLLYSPTYERINIGIAPGLKLQNAIGLRAYYNL